MEPRSAPARLGLSRWMKYHSATRAKKRRVMTVEAFARSLPLDREPRGGAIESAGLGLQGREQDIALVEQLIARVDQGGRTLVVTGEPGIGKTALLAIAQ